MREKICRENNSSHLCVLSCKSKDQEIRNLTKNPQSVCYDCGRTADFERNVCRPFPIEYKKYVEQCHKMPEGQ